ncbi:MAG: DNA repair protein RecO [Thainema sp.]
MSRTYKATGINLRSIPFGEYDRLLTVLTLEHGLLRAIAPGSRKHNSRLSARSGLFVVNQLLIVKGKSLDKIIQAETVTSYPGLSQDLCKLTVSQYLAELVLYQALSDQPQEDLFERLQQYLQQIEQASSATSLVYLVHGVFHLLLMAGVEPQIFDCCMTQEPIVPDFDLPDWQAGFSVAAGGVLSLPALDQLEAERYQRMQAAGMSSPVRTNRRAVSRDRTSIPATQAVTRSTASAMPSAIAAEGAGRYQTEHHAQPLADVDYRLNARELKILQEMAQTELSESISLAAVATELRARFSCRGPDWLKMEQLLRKYAQYHFEQPIRSAALVETCFLPYVTKSVNPP